MSREAMLDYLVDLEQNNNREWFGATKQRRDLAQGTFEALVGATMERIGTFDPSVLGHDPKKLMFKLPRDTRFSKDTSPYNPSMRAHIGPAGKAPVPVGYYLSLQPHNRSFLGAGLFAPMFKDATERIRKAIASQGDTWERVIGAPAFTERFHVEGESLKRVPQGFDPDHPQGVWLKLKSWYVEYPVSDDLVTSTGFADYAAEVFQSMSSLNTFLNEALKGFVMPKR